MRQTSGEGRSRKLDHYADFARRELAGHTPLPSRFGEPHLTFWREGGFCAVFAIAARTADCCTVSASSCLRAAKIWDSSTGPGVPDSQRNCGCDGTADMSEAQAARIVRFSKGSSSASERTSRGWTKSCALN